MCFLSNKPYLTEGIYDYLNDLWFIDYVFNLKEG